MEKLTLEQLRKQIRQRNGKETLSELAKEIHETLGDQKTKILLDFLFSELGIFGDPSNIYYSRNKANEAR